MRTYQVRTGSKLFYVAAFTKGEALAHLRDDEGIERNMVRSIKRVSVSEDTIPEHTNTPTTVNVNADTLDEYEQSDDGVSSIHTRS